MKAKITFVLSIALIFLSFSLFAQEGYWKEVQMTSKNQSYLKSNVKSDKAKLYELNLKEFLSHINIKGSSEVLLPDSDGELKEFTLEPFNQLAPELAKAYPAIRSFKARRAGSNELIWISISKEGIQMMIMNPKTNYHTYVEPSREHSNYYTWYSSKDKEAEDHFVCSTKDYDQVARSIASTLANEQVVYTTYRLAISVSGEYTTYFGGTVEGALSAINATLTRVNGILSRDLSVKLELISSTVSVIYTDAETDPYSSDYNSELQSTLDEVIGVDNYDIGHLFLQGSSNGNAGYIGGICLDGKKGSGFTSGASPQGDSFDIDYVAHEIGHQLGANHTWSYQSEGTRAQVEPGSGTTLMSYAGIVAGENIASQASDYFHGISIDQINATLANRSCGTVQSVENTTPELSSVPNYTIPLGTPFKLETVAVDQETQSNVTYCWEQIDAGVVASADFGPTNSSGAAFRSLPPKAVGVRYFPGLSSVKKNELTLINPKLGDSWETLSEVPRVYNFMATARDNDPYGGVDQITTKVSVTKDAGPFKVTSQSSQLTYDGGSLQEVSWDVAGTNRSAIAETTVDLFLSTDGGNTFPIKIAEEVANDGNAQVIIPNIATTQARIMVAAHKNIFFSMNTSDFTIVAKDFALVGNTSELSICKEASTSIDFTYEVSSTTSQTATISVSGLPDGVTANLSASTLSEDGAAFSLTINSDATVAAGMYSFNLNAESTTASQTIPLKLVIRDAAVGTVDLVSPQHMQQGVLQDVDLKWNPNFNVEYYELQLSTDENFTSIVSTVSTTFNSIDIHDLSPDTIYYWRVRGINSCGSGDYDSVYSFQVTATECTTLTATDLPKPISDSRISTVRSQINFEQDLPISSISVAVKINHTWIPDISVSLISPSGTIVQLLNYSCGNYDADIDAVFSDDGVALNCSSSGTAVSGTVIPISPLSLLKGESSKGIWTLEVKDAAELDGGSIEAFSINACFQGTIRPDADGDGVFDDGDDLCLDTPFGQKVDTHGCPVYQLDKNNFLASVSSQSCRDQSDGIIELSAVSSMNYSYSVSGPNGYSKNGSFTSNTNIVNLAVGDYQICIVGSDDGIQYDQVCLSARITQPEPLSVLTAVTYENQELNLSLDGSSFYTVEVNDQSYFVSGKNLDVPLEEGYNKIKVTGDLSCMGSYEEEIYFSKLPVAYPNPIKEQFFINTELLKNKNVSIQIKDMNANNMYRYKGLMIEDEFGFDTKYWSKGIYVMQLKFEGTTVIYKLIKE